MSVETEKLFKIAHAADDLYLAKLNLQNAFEAILQVLQEFDARLEKLEKENITKS